MRVTSRLVCVATCAAALSAQNYTVSPRRATNADMFSANTIPWWSATHRYHQVHGDLRNHIMVARELSFRRDGPYVNTGAVARTVDAELNMGKGDFATASVTF